MLSAFRASSAAVQRTSRRFLATTTTTTPQKSEYVHPLSQLVLEHLQTSRSDWIQRTGLDKGLVLQKDGTFLLKFPSYEIDQSRIWTWFDNEEKKHWLTVHKGELVGRFLLQDNMKPAWNDSKSTPEKVQNAVDAMIDRIESLE
jgi:hypothetical protein